MRPDARPMATVGALTCMLASGIAAADVQPHAGMLRYPDVGQDKIVFAYANDLWTVDRAGGQATPLASPPGEERLPKFSPDGQTIAFMGNYDGNLDLYTIPVTGGLAYRVTHHPTGETLCGWNSDDELMFFARGIQGHPRASQMYTVSVDGGFPEQLPPPYGTFSSISEDGTWLAYTPDSRETRTWKRYRGGLATDIWLFNLKTYESMKVTDWEGTDALPMWHGDKVYYLSDNGEQERLNIWVYDTAARTNTQITQFSEYDVKWPSMGPGANGQGEIVFQNGTSLYLLDLRTKSANPVTVTIPGDRPELRTQRIDVSNFVQGGSISATGKRAVTSARGDVWTVPAEKGIPRNLTRTSGVAERDPVWSPDGKWIAYFSDADGDYEMYITQSDGKGETKQLTDGNQTYWVYANWSPDSEKIVLTDKDCKIFLYDFETEALSLIDQDPQANSFATPNWTSDSRWFTYARSMQEAGTSCIWIYDTENGEKHRVTTGMFPDTDPVFDRKGEYLYYASRRVFSPTYEDFGNTWIYQESGALIAVPLRDDVDAPWPLENEEEEWDDEADEDEDAEADEESDADAEDADTEEDAEDAEAGEGEEEDDDDEADEDAAPMHPLHGVWEGQLTGLKAMLDQMIPPEAPAEVRDMISDTAPYRLDITVDEDGNISGTSTVEIMGQSQSDDMGDVTFNEDTGEYLETDEEDGVKSVMRGVLEGNTISGTWEISGMMNGTGTWSVTKTEEEPEEAEDEEAAEEVEIDLEGFEARGMQLPVGRGNYGNLAVNDKNQLLYVKAGEGIKLFDLGDDGKAEKSVVAGAMGFMLSADGKKMLYADPGGIKIGNASSGSSGKAVKDDGMIALINPREEWKQVFTDAWRIQRDWFYVKNMHGVDWDGVYEQYAPMIDDCATREDVSYVIGEMISELNVGHSYYFGGGTDFGTFVNVGMLGVDFELTDEGYRIKKIHQGSPWDSDARGPIFESGVDLEEGDYLLAVNGIPIDTSKDPWAAFIGTAGQTTILTVKTDPARLVEDEDEDEEGDADEDGDTEDADADEDEDEGDDEDEDEVDPLAEGEVILEPARGDGRLRYRGWIEHNRAYVEKMTDGQVGYIYVPDTGVNGQSDLLRQFVGQFGKKALIIDERWNGGGQLPDRFIELLNRPVSSYFAVRDNKPFKVPALSHAGPKCMLINGNAGSGGDMFPYLFRHAKLGKLIGTRTWGGLVGMSGNPPLIDGGYTSVPRIGFYETDGTWGVEGHGVDPDIEVIADPSLMVDGGDPQLDAAIAQMLKELETNAFVPVPKPADPDRSGIGVTEEDR